MIIKDIAVGPLDVNCYILACDDTKEAAVIDPGGDADKIIETIEKEGFKPKFIINTHAHFDHVGGVKTIQEHFNIDFFLHKDDLFLLESINEQSTFFGLGPVLEPTVNKHVNHQDNIKLGENNIKVIHTPGHTPGGVCYYVGNDVFVGDTLFAGSIGRTDFPGSSHEALINSIKEQLFPLDDKVIVHPGHGPSTTIGNEKHSNLFLT